MAFQTKPEKGCLETEERVTPPAASVHRSCVWVAIEDTLRARGYPFRPRPLSFSTITHPDITHSLTTSISFKTIPP